MAVTINSNLASLFARRRFGESSSALTRSSERSSSGLRINRPSGDAAGPAIASALNISSRVFNRGLQNIRFGIGRFKVAKVAGRELGLDIQPDVLSQSKVTAGTR